MKRFLQRLRDGGLVDLAGMIFRFGVTGGLGAATFLATFYALITWTRVHYLAASLAAWVSAFCISFVLQRRWTFGRSGPGAGRQLIAYVALWLTNMGLNEVALFLLVDKAHAPKFAAQFALLVMISVWNFFIMRYLIFRAPGQGDH